MRVAVLTLTRDRLLYSQHCFDTLRANAGIEFDWYVLDQGSTDGTPEWLDLQDDLTFVTLDRNVGITRGLNYLLDEMVYPADFEVEPSDYDVIVRFDNDCEVVQPGTLRAVCEAAYDFDAILAPHVQLLRHPPAVVGEVDMIGETIQVTNILGGIFMAIPARLFTDLGYRYDETHPAWTGDEAIVPWWRAQGGVAGYLDGWHVNHYERVQEQADTLPDYQARKAAEVTG